MEFFEFDDSFMAGHTPIRGLDKTYCDDGSHCTNTGSVGSLNPQMLQKDNNSRVQSSLNFNTKTKATSFKLRK